ncbi:MAG: 2-methylcitrate synthase, partial [uncultured Quadrisphaera sp.]
AQGPGGSGRRHHRDLGGGAGDELADLPGPPRPGAGRAVQHRGRRAPALARRAAGRGGAGRVRGPRARPAGVAAVAGRGARAAAGHLPPDGRAAHRGQRARRAGPRRGRPVARARAGRLGGAVRGAADGGGRRRPPPPGAAPDRPGPGPGVRGELLRDGHGRGARAGGAARLRGLPGALRRALLQRLDVHRTGDRLDPGRRALRGHRGGRGAARPAARRGQRGRDGDDARGRRSRAGRRLAARGPRGQAEGHGLRAPGLQGRRLPGAHDEGGPGRPRRGGRRRAAVAGDVRRARAGDGRGEGHPPQPRLPDRARVPPDGLRDGDVHPVLRAQPRGRVDGARDGAAGGQRPDPPAEPLHRPGAAPGPGVVPPAGL